MKTPRRKKKQIDVKVDTPNIDATIQRDEEGNVNIDIDSKRVDVHVEKTEDKISIDIEIDDKAVYQFESNGKAARMPKGMIFKISGAMLKLFLKQGFGRLKK
jgi:hypothetical protein